jgi:hypothetical protein
MSFENPGFESFENKEKTKEQVIEEIKSLGGFGSEEAKNIFGEWLDQWNDKEKENINIYSDEDRLNHDIDIAEIYYQGGAPVQDVIDLYYEARWDAQQRGNVEKVEFINNEMNKVDPEKKLTHSDPGFFDQNRGEK